MTDTPQDDGLVERVAHQLYDAMRPETAPPYWLCERAAIAAMPDIAALRAENEALRWGLRDLLDDTQHSQHNCGDPECPVDAARALLGSKP